GADPTAGGSWRTLAMKEIAGNLSWALYPFGDGGRPGGHANTGTDLWASGPAAPALNTWTHFATTYDGTTIRLFVNGVQVGTRAQTGSLLQSTQPLRFGGTAVWAEWFQGRLDEIRVYNRALTAAQIQADMTQAVTPGT
ncbi:MAG TPA: LamG domain-containing protein, partial [Solirubrobacteraceae bacterium]